MNEEDLMRSLHSLSCAKYKLLIKSPVGNRIAKTDSFKLNHNFSDKARRIKVGPPPSCIASWSARHLRCLISCVVQHFLCEA